MQASLLAGGQGPWRLMLSSRRCGEARGRLYSQGGQRRGTRRTEPPQEEEGRLLCF